MVEKALSDQQKEVLKSERTLKNTLQRNNVVLN